MSLSTPNRTWVVGETVTASIMNQWIRDQLAAIAPLGRYDFICAQSGGYQNVNIINGGFAECNHAALSRSTYAAYDALLAAMTPVRPFGAGDGTSTFNLPDLFGRSPVAHGSHADVSQLGKSDGVAAPNRTPQHGTSSNLTISGLTISNVVVPDHVHDVGTFNVPATAQHTHSIPAGTFPSINDPGHSHVMAAALDGGNSNVRRSADTGNGIVNLNTNSATTGISLSGGSWPTQTGLGGGGGGGINGQSGGIVGGAIPIQASVSGGTLGGSVGASGVRPVDAPGYQVAGIWVVKVVP